MTTMATQWPECLIRFLPHSENCFLICKKSTVVEEYEGVLEQQRVGVLQRHQGFPFKQP